MSVPICVDNTKRIKFQSRVIKFYQENGRQFPWRETEDPFKIIVAEILLKRTGAWKTRVVYVRILEEYDTVRSMSKADIDKLRETIRPLGLLYRAELLVDISKDIVKRFDGKVPESLADLESIKGVGHYTANAVLCLAYRKRVPLVDESVKRIFSRSLSFESSKKAYQDSELWQLANSLLPKRKVKEYNLGLLDLGAIVCKYKRPLCKKCPLAGVICTWLL